MAAAIALAFANNLGVTRVILEGDSLVVIKALKEEEQLLSPTGLLLKDVKMLSQSFQNLLYSHTKREGNSVAHSLARYASSIPDFLVWMEDVHHAFSLLYKLIWLLYVNKVHCISLSKKKKKLAKAFKVGCDSRECSCSSTTFPFIFGSNTPF